MNHTKNSCRIVKGETSEGLFWILVFQYGKVEFRCQDYEGWHSEELGLILESNANILTYEEIMNLIHDYELLDDVASYK